VKKEDEARVERAFIGIIKSDAKDNVKREKKRREASIGSKMMCF
jgi:hypothetical protein